MDLNFLDLDSKTPFIGWKETEMIEKPTMLILGAGASVPYGFPSGRGLKQIILKSLGTSGIMNLRQKLQDLGFDPLSVESFRNDLFYSGWSSVDAFLEYRPKFIEIGKLAMALLLFPFELEDKIFEEKDSGNSWYHHLFEKLKTDFDSFDKNKISIITFNYDRSLEHFLFTTLRYSYGKSEEECAAKLEAIPIIHLYGRLGAMPWQNTKEKKMDYTRKKEYDKIDYLKEISEVRDQIKIISEGKEETPEFSKAYDLMRIAKRIYFLGFGYNEINLKRLRIKDIPHTAGKEIYGTFVGLGSKETENIHNHWDINFGSSEKDILASLKDTFGLD